MTCLHLWNCLLCLQMWCALLLNTFWSISHTVIIILALTHSYEAVSLPHPLPQGTSSIHYYLCTKACTIYFLCFPSCKAMGHCFQCCLPFSKFLHPSHYTTLLLAPGHRHTFSKWCSHHSHLHTSKSLHDNFFFKLYVQKAVSTSTTLAQSLKWIIIISNTLNIMSFMIGQ